MLQLILHGWGDYILQSTWLALNKSKRSLPCAIHCFTYTVPFLIATRSWSALFVIFATHYLIDRYGLARSLVWFKELQGPIQIPWRYCRMTGYFDVESLDTKTAVEGYFITGAMSKQAVADLIINPSINRPIWIRVWLTIIADNTLHLTCNYLAITQFTPAFDHWLLHLAHL